MAANAKSTSGIPGRKIITANVTSATDVEKDVVQGPCTLHSIKLKNGSDEFVYAHFFNDLDPTLDTSDAELKVLGRKVGVENGHAGFLVDPQNGGMRFATGLSFGASTAAAGTGDPTGVDVTLVVTPG